MSCSLDADAEWTKHTAHFLVNLTRVKAELKPLKKRDSLARSLSLCCFARSFEKCFIKILHYAPTQNFFKNRNKSTTFPLQHVNGLNYNYEIAHTSRPRIRGHHSNYHRQVEEGRGGGGSLLMCDCTWAWFYECRVGGELYHLHQYSPFVAVTDRRLVGIGNATHTQFFVLFVTLFRDAVRDHCSP